MKNEIYIISEYGLIGKDDSVVNYNKFLSKKVPSQVYNELEEFAKTDYGKEIFSFSGNGKYLQAKSYVGTIQTKSGHSIEILPKIYKNKENEDNSKEIFLQLLRMLYKLPNYKQIEKANFQNEKMPLLEIFIYMFLEEVAFIIKKGIKSDYISQEDNLYYLKGKLLIKEQIKRNYIHKERFYVDYDEYTTNRAENNLIKSTLKYLMNISSSFQNLRLIRMYQEHMYSVEYSLNFDADFKKCKTNIRGMEHYKNALIWAKVFLKKESFSSFSGDTISFAILYPMEKLFENYMKHKLNERYLKYKVHSQNGEKTFIHNKNEQLFGLRPDFIINSKDTIKIIADAKWKIIEDSKSFSQSDFYQLFAYQHIFKPKKALRLYYPMSDYFKKIKKFIYTDERKTKIFAIPIDMNELLQNKS